MVRLLRFALGLLAFVLVAPSVWAQIPPAGGAAAGLGGATGGAAGGAAGGASGLAGAAGAAQPMNIFSFLLPTKAQKKECLEHICSTPIGQLLDSMLAPVSLYSGGLVPGLCPDTEDQANAEDLKKPADSAEGAAAKIKKSEAEAKARRAAVQYLGTVDCLRYPEAEAGLITSLRADPNECVRFEAAKVLGRGCCCTRKTIEALTLTVSGSRKDGNPRELSHRVRAMAAMSLDACLHRYCDIEPIELARIERPEQPPARPESPEPPESQQASPPPVPVARAPAPTLSRKQAVLQARRVLAWHQQQSGQPPGRLTPVAVRSPESTQPALAPTQPRALRRPPQPTHSTPATGKRSLWNLIRSSSRSPVPFQAGHPGKTPPGHTTHRPSVSHQRYKPRRTTQVVHFQRSPGLPPSAQRPVSPKPPKTRRSLLPPTGKRGLFNLFVHSLRGGTP